MDTDRLNTVRDADAGNRRQWSISSLPNLDEVAAAAGSLRREKLLLLLLL